MLAQVLANLFLPVPKLAPYCLIWHLPALAILFPRPARVHHCPNWYQDRLLHLNHNPRSRWVRGECAHHV
jgi:hypothetical protein